MYLFWLDVAIQVDSFDQSESIILEKTSYAILKFVYEIGFWGLCFKHNS